MKRVEGLGRLAVPVLVFASLALAPIAMAAGMGFYAGTFDPPTRAEIGMLRCALGDVSVSKECAAIGKTIERLVVSVDESSDEDTLASTRERALMVNKALQKYRNRLEIQAAPGNREEKIRALLENRNVERVVRFIDSDSYQAVKSSRAVKIQSSFGWYFR